MTVAFLWPLALLCCLPVIVILYLMRPKGTEKQVPSNLLWRRLFDASAKASFFRRFITDPLLLLELLIALLLILSLMKPMIRTDSAFGGDVAILLDTGAGMQHLCSDGKSRFEKAKEYAVSYAGEHKGNLTIIACDSQARLLLSRSTDSGAARRILQNTEVSDRPGDLSAAASLLQGIEADRILVLTDGASDPEGSGASAIGLDDWEGKLRVICFGDSASNLALRYLAEGSGDVVAMITNFSDRQASCDVSLFAPDGQILSSRRTQIAPGAGQSVLFQDLPDTGTLPYLKAELSDIVFYEQDREDQPLSVIDSLEKDNIGYLFSDQTKAGKAALVGGSNRFLEKAYQAATGTTLPRLENETLLTDEKLAIYDYGYRSADGSAGELSGIVKEGESAPSVLRFGDPSFVSGTLEHTVLTFTQGEPVAGIEGATFGVNAAYSYEVPAWGKSFLEAGGKCCGYYGTDPQGIRRVVLGFDLRESDLPLLAEFPVLVADCVQYLSGRSLVKERILTAGQPLLLNPSAEQVDETALPDTGKVGLYEIRTKEGEEYVAVLFPMEEESDGRIGASGDTSSVSDMRMIRVKKSISAALLLLALLCLGLDLFLYVKKSRYRGRGVYALGILTALLILAALLDLRLPGKNTGRATIFLADLSDSNRENREKIEDYLTQQLSQKPAGDYYGLVTFGKDAEVDQFLTKSDHFAGISTHPVSTATNLAGAVSRALSMLPEGASGRIVLLTDGKATEGLLESMKPAVTQPGIELCALFLEDEETDDCYIESASMPSVLHPGDSYRIEVTVKSNYETDAVISLLSESRSIKQQKVHLYRGANSFAFGMDVSGSESEHFQVKVTAEGDGCPQNDAYHVYAKVAAGERMLVIAGKNSDNGELSRVLEAANVDFDLVSVRNAPTGLEGLASYKTVFLENVYIGDLSEGFKEDIETYVRDYGGGLIVSGGEDSFALGGYNETVLEKILPVDMEPRGMDETPAVCMVMIIDCSGSMVASDSGGPTRLDLAIESACRAVDNLTGKDYVGVITFDDTPEWQVPIVLAKDKEAIKEGIRKTREGGGTMIRPALEEGFQKLAATDAPTRHMLLLTDGQGETSDFDSQIEAINDAGITLSAVAVGEDSDRTLLGRLATKCGGRFYAADAGSDIPRIFAKEVFMSGDSYLQNGDFALISDGGALTKDLFSEGWPHITGYVSSTPKPGAMSALVSDKEDPILTAWQYGLGRAIAWNTDVSGVWTGGFSGNDSYAALWKRICEYSFASGGDGGDTVEYVAAREEGGENLIRYSLEQYSDQTAVSGVYTTPDGERKELELTQRRPGVYEANLPESEAGVYFISAGRTDGGKTGQTVTGAAILQFSDEYRFDKTSAAARSFIESCGRELSPDANVWTRQKTRSSAAKSMEVPFLISALVLFLLGIAERRMELFRFFVKVLPAARKRNSREEDVQAAQKRAAADLASADPASADPAAQGLAMPTAEEGRMSEAATGPTPSQAGGKTRQKSRDPGKSAGESTKKTEKNTEKKAAEQTASSAGLDTAYLLKKKRDRGGS